MTLAIVWFRRDLRLTDNPALQAALRSSSQVLSVYVHAPEEEAPWAAGAASRWWLHHSLVALDADLEARGSRLLILNAASLPALQQLIADSGATAVHWNRLYEPKAIERDALIKATLRRQDIIAESHNAALFHEPWEIKNRQGEPYRVFTPFWRTARAALNMTPPIAAPLRLTTPEIPQGVALEDLKLLPAIRWDSGFGGYWKPGERGATEALELFTDSALRDYPIERDRPDHRGTSRLSPHLHFGEIGPRQIAWELHRHARERSERMLAAVEPYLRELGWREFSHYLLFHFPQTSDVPLNVQFEKFPWAADNRRQLQAWRAGKTGIPIVDAGMRELWTTGWMHNRVRMIVASFLTKNLRQHWLHGAHWFWDTLVDADLANNTQGWQWTSGCGADAAPYFRIFNPVTQGQRFDPDGNYVRRWVPELADISAKAIHDPWTDPTRLTETGYPLPIVDLKTSREAALNAYRQMRASS